MANDDMVEDFDLEQLTSSNEIARDFDVRFGRRRVAAGMIMGTHNCRCAGGDCQSKNLSWMNEYGVHCSNGNQIVSLNASACIEY